MTAAPAPSRVPGAGTFSIAVGAALVDLAAKAVGTALLRGAPVDLPGPLWLRLVHNPGVAFGLGASAPGWLTLGVTFLVAASFAALVWRGTFGVSAVAPGLILGGAVGNLVDRAVGGTVVDLFDLGWWPAFNLADVFITVGAALLLLHGSKEPNRATHESTDEPVEEGGARCE